MVGEELSMMNLTHDNCLRMRMNNPTKISMALLIMATLGGYGVSAGAQASEPQTAQPSSTVGESVTLREIEQINGEVTRLKALTAQAEERLKLLRAQNQIEQELRQGKQAAGHYDTTAQGPMEPAPQVALISGSGASLRAVLRYPNGSSDEAWVGKQLPGGYVVHSITSRQVRLRTPKGQVIVAGTASPTPETKRSSTPQAPSMGSPMAPLPPTTPGAFPRGAINPMMPSPMPPEPSMSVNPA